MAITAINPSANDFLAIQNVSRVIFLPFQMSNTNRADATRTSVEHFFED